MAPPTFYGTVSSASRDAKVPSEVTLDTELESLTTYAPPIPVKRPKRLTYALLVLRIGLFFIVAGGVWHLTMNYVNHIQDSYHYIVVGAGPAGIIVATRLAKAFPREQILLLESGTDSQTSVLQSLVVSPDTDKSKHSNVPPLPPSTLSHFDIPLFWSGVASSQGRAQNLFGQGSDTHHWPIDKTLLGRGIGGSGLHNAMIYIRCLPTDLQRWNVTGWKYEDVLHHYRTLETYLDVPDNSFWKDKKEDALAQELSWRGRHGPVTTTPAATVDAIAPHFVASALQRGIPLAVRGFNSPNPSDRIGAGYYEFNIKHGVRDSIARAFLGQPGSKPTNLDVRSGYTVTRVLFHKNKIAKGVEYVRYDGTVGQFVLTRDSFSQVILTAGAILTPQLLVNSGIGPHGSLVHSPQVGENLQDHPVVALAYNITPEISQAAPSIYTVGDEMQDYLLSVAQLHHLELNGQLSAQNFTVKNYLREKIGTFGTSGFSAGAFLRSPYAEDESPDIQLTVFPRQLEPHVTRKQKREDVAFLRSHVMLVTVALLRPDARYRVYSAQKPAHDALFTRNNVPICRQDEFFCFDNHDAPHLNVESPLANLLDYRLPSIDLPEGAVEYLSDRDVERLAWGMEQVRLIQGTGPLSEVTMEEIAPGTNIADEDLRRHVRSMTLPNSHWAGSTRMGTDDASVVDERLRVRGVEKLRIMDAGVIPHVPNGNTHSTVSVVASIGAKKMIEERTHRR